MTYSGMTIVKICMNIRHPVQALFKGGGQMHGWTDVHDDAINFFFLEAS
jgi:hypothetical protein